MNSDSSIERQRLERLESARALALGGDFSESLAVIEQVLDTSPSDIEALRLRGNVLEQKALDRHEIDQKKLTRSPDYLLARQCYEDILKADPKNIVALIDLGDHFKNLDAYDQAFRYYERAIALIETDTRGAKRTEHVLELVSTALDLSRREDTASRADRMKRACEEVLRRDTANS